MTVAILLASRTADRYLAVLAAASALAVLLAPYGLKVHMAAQYPATIMGIPELCAVLLTCVGVIQLRPRMWIVDRLGTPRRRWIAAIAAALVTIAGPQLVLALAALRGDAWAPSASTILFLSGLALLAAPFVGASHAGTATLLLYITLTFAAQLTPVVDRLSPLAPVTWPTVAPVPAGKLAIAVVTAGIALAVTARTLGQTMRTWGRDADPS